MKFDEDLLNRDKGLPFDELLEDLQAGRALEYFVRLDMLGDHFDLVRSKRARFETAIARVKGRGATIDARQFYKRWLTKASRKIGRSSCCASMGRSTTETSFAPGARSKILIPTSCLRS